MNIMALSIFMIINMTVSILGSIYDHRHYRGYRIPRGFAVMVICASCTLALFYYMGWFGNV